MKKFTSLTKKVFFTLAILSLLVFCISSADVSDTRKIVDMRGKEIEIPTDINRVITIDNGLVEGVMTILGESDKIVGLGASLAKPSETTIPSDVSGNITYKNGMNPVGVLNPGFEDLPLVKESSGGINYETLASLEPDVVIVRRGSCAASWELDDEGYNKDIDTIEKLGIPVIVTNAPPCYDNPDVSSISDEIKLIGKVFDKEQESESIINYIDDTVSMIKERTAKVSGDKPKVLALGLAPNSRSAGGAGNIRGAIVAYYIETLANAENAYSVTRYTSDSGVINAEQVLALDPDVIILPTSSGYHPPHELYDAPYYANLRELRAVKNRDVYALPYTPSNCDASRLEYPIDAMIIAKAAYPDLFEDITVNDWVLDYYQNLYGVDMDTAKEIRSSHWLDWMEEIGF